MTDNTQLIILDHLWNRLHHNAWEAHRVTHEIGNPNPKNPYLPKPKVASIPKAAALDTREVIHATARILGSIWPEEHPHLPAPLAVELVQTDYLGWLFKLQDADRATWLAAIHVYPHAIEYKTNRHGTTKLRPAAPDDAIMIGAALVALAAVRDLDPNDLEPAYICEGDLAELERIAGLSSYPKTRARRLLTRPTVVC